MDNRKSFSKKDLIIIMAVLLVSAVMYVMLNSSENGKTATVTVEGKTVHTINLDSEEEHIVIIEDSDYPLEVHYDSTGIWIENATCPDKLCENSGKITKSGESIICIPGRTTVVFDAESEFDAITH